MWLQLIICSQVLCIVKAIVIVKPSEVVCIAYNSGRTLIYTSQGRFQSKCYWGGGGGGVPITIGAIVPFVPTSDTPGGATRVHLGRDV